MTSIAESPQPVVAHARPLPASWGLSRFWWLILFFWLIVSLASGLEVFLLHMVSLNQVVMETLSRLTASIVMTLTVVWISSIHTLDRANWKRTIWIYVAGCALSLSVMAILSYFGSPPHLAMPAGGSHSMAVSILLRLTYQLPIYWGLVAAAHAVRLYEREHIRQLRESELQTRLIQSRLQALQSQLNPHFLFNALNSIASLLHDHPAKAEKMIESLGGLLRLAINNTDRQLVTLREELHFLDEYLFIQRIRFGERLQVETQVDQAVLDEKVPALILQPLVENAIKHGVESHTGPTLIRIAARAEPDERLIRLEISNDGPVARDNGRKIEERVGLSNTRARLEVMFGSRADLELLPCETGGYVTRISIFREEGAGRPSKVESQPELP
jgi:two-component system, LytTR family, sensor kinase